MDFFKLTSSSFSYHHERKRLDFGDAAKGSVVALSSVASSRLGSQSTLRLATEKAEV